MLMRVRTGEEPPAAAVAEEGRVGMRAGDKIGDMLPLRGKRSGAIKADSAGAQRFRNHIKILVPAEDAGIRKMKRLGQHDPLILPGQAVMAGGQANFAAVILV